MSGDRARISLREGWYTDEYLIGYRSPVYQALWKRILRWGGPRVLSYCWLAFCLWLCLMFLFAKWPWLIIGVGVLWVGVQGVIILITQWDLQFDEVLRDTPKYHVRIYDAG